MKAEFFEKLKEELSSIRKEGEIEELNIEEEGKFQFCGYDEEEINIPAKRAYRPKKAAAAVMLVLALTAGLLGVPDTSITETNPYTVEAKSKKDKKKPVIKFSGKTKITVEKGKSVKIPKTTAKDNKDGNVTKKITVTVKKGKKKYNSIAKAVKKDKKVKFTSTGTYKITYTVKDKAGNKATKTRTIKVVAPKKKTVAKTTENVTTETPTTQSPTTQAKTTENVTTEQPTTEKSTVETPIIKYPILEAPVEGDGEYKIHIVNIAGNRYEVVNDRDFQHKIEEASTVQDKITIEIENDYDYMMFSKDSRLIENVGFLEFIGKITAKDQNGKGFSGITIYAPIINKENAYNTIYIYVEDTEGNSLAIPVKIYIKKWDENYIYTEDTYAGNDYNMLSKDPLVYGHLRQNTNSNSLGAAKTLELVKE